MVVYWTGQMFRVMSHRGLFWALALLFIHDIPDIIEGGVRMFADNTKIYCVIRNFDDCLRLYHDLNQLSQWSTVWLLRFNAAKCILSNANQLFSCNVIPHDQ